MSATRPSRNLWPISIGIFFVLAAIFLGTFVVWAMRQREDLVSADYYEHEVRYQQQLDSMNRSRPLAEQVIVTYDPARQHIVITLPAARMRGATGRVHLYRPSDARLDRDLPLALNVDGIQQLDAKGLADGLWKVHLNWTVNGEEYFLDQPVIVTSS